MPSNVYVNNQVQSLQLVTTVSGGLDPAHYSVRPGPIPFGQTVSYLSFDRSEGIKNGHTYIFTTVFALGIIQYTMTISLTGTFFDSNFTVEVIGVSGAVKKQAGPLKDTGSESFDLGFIMNGNVSNPSSKANYETANEFQYRLILQREGGAIHDDVRVTIQPTLQRFTGSLPLPVLESTTLTSMETPDYVGLLDVWGEGRIITNDNPPIVSGFTEAYNLNHKNQMISNGPNTGKPIPNKLNIDDYENPKFPLGNGRVRYITLMGAPITVGTAKEMYRVLDKKRGVVFLYNPDKKDRENFEQNKGNLVRKPDDPLNPPFNQPSFKPVFIYGFRNAQDKDEL